MSTIEKSIEVDAPISTVYNQWTQFEEFPQFMEGVDEVRQLDDTHLHWVASFGGTQHEWDAEIVEQRPDERIAWRTTSGTGHSGIVTFEPAGTGETRVSLHIDTDPHGLVERAGDVLGVPGRLRRLRARVRR